MLVPSATALYAALALVAVILSSASMGEEAVEMVDGPADVEALVFRNASCWSTSHTGHASTAQSEAGRLSLKCYAIAEELSLNLGDGRGQAAAA